MALWQIIGILVIGAVGLMLPFGFFDTYEKMQETENDEWND